MEWRLLFAQVGWEQFLVLPVWFSTPGWGLDDPKGSLIYLRCEATTYYYLKLTKLEAAKLQLGLQFT